MSSLIFVFVCFIFETASHYVALAVLEDAKSCQSPGLHGGGGSKEAGEPAFFHRLVKLCVLGAHWATIQSLELWVARVMHQGELGPRQGRPSSSASLLQDMCSAQLQ